MNFYIGNTVEEIDCEDYNIEFCDELIDFIYKLRGICSFDMSKLYQINPYDDVRIPKSDLQQIIGICNYLLKTSLIQTYKGPDEGEEMLRMLINIAGEAMLNDKGLISIGD